MRELVPAFRNLMDLLTWSRRADQVLRETVDEAQRKISGPELGLKMFLGDVTLGFSVVGRIQLRFLPLRGPQNAILLQLRTQDSSSRACQVWCPSLGRLYLRIITRHEPRNAYAVQVTFGTSRSCADFSIGCHSLVLHRGIVAGED